MHVHVPAAHAEGHGSEVHEHAHEISVIDADHDAEHATHSDIDESMAKAFGKLSLTHALPAVLLIYLLIAAFGDRAYAFVLRTPPRRPPKPRPPPFFLPPSHAPPHAIPSR